VHGEDQALAAMKSRAASVVGEERVFVPHIDSVFRLETDGPVDISTFLAPPRLDPELAGHRDWNNDYQSLIQDFQAELRNAADDKARRAIVRKIRRALES